MRRAVLDQLPPVAQQRPQRYQVVETFARLIHENERAGIMVTHDLRMCKYVDRVLQMRDGKLVRVIEDRNEIEKLAKGE
jgi:putative ABC transport system ATP-binding protein